MTIFYKCNVSLYKYLLYLNTVFNCFSFSIQYNYKNINKIDK